MHFFDALLGAPVWHLLTRLGEVEILLPAAALTALALLVRSATRLLALRWLLLIGVAAALTVASKVAFIGWGLGWKNIDFTGISGHAMFSAAIYPVLALCLVRADVHGRRAIAFGYGLAVLIAISRMVIGVHSASEVAAGLLIGAAASATALAWSDTPILRIRPLLPLALVAWMALTPLHLPASQTHSLVTRLALALSGHNAPYTRSDLLHPKPGEKS